MNNFKKLQTENEKKLSEFLEFFELSLCKRCWANRFRRKIYLNKQLIKTQPEFTNIVKNIREKDKEPDRNPHTHGGVLEFLDGLSLKENEVSYWIKEPIHGFLHGFLVLFLAYNISKQKDQLWETVFHYDDYATNYPRITTGDKFITTCILHDYLKVFDDKHHDKNLINISQLFDPVVYNHSNPNKNEENHPLIGADRIELMRFDNYKEWCNESVLSPYIENYGGKDLIDHFYKHIRPVIEKIFLDRYDIWVSHWLENGWDPVPFHENNKDVDYYPKAHWIAQDPGFKNNKLENKNDYISVNMGKLYQRKCFYHGNINKPALGYLSLKSLKKNNGQLKSAPITTSGRDHPFILEKTKIPISEWFFVYNNESQIDAFDEKNLYIINEFLFEKIIDVTEMFITRLCGLGIK